MDLYLAGKIAVVTGASKGIGFATAMLLAEEGCNLILIARDADRLQSAAAKIGERGAGTVRTIPADLSERSEIESVASLIDEIDILVNNAGAIPPGDLATLAEGKWREGWELKVFGYIGLSRALYPKLMKRGGVIVNVIGAAGEKVDWGYIAGSTGNAALMAFTRALGSSSPLDGVRVVGINPGPVLTERLATLSREKGSTRSAFGRPARPEEIANAVAFLASSRSSYTSGTILTIDDPLRHPSL